MQGTARSFALKTNTQKDFAQRYLKALLFYFWGLLRKVQIFGSSSGRFLLSLELLFQTLLSSTGPPMGIWGIPCKSVKGKIQGRCTRQVIKTEIHFNSSSHMITSLPEALKWHCAFFFFFPPLDKMIFVRHPLKKNSGMYLIKISEQNKVSGNDEGVPKKPRVWWLRKLIHLLCGIIKSRSHSKLQNVIFLILI